LVEQSNLFVQHIYLGEDVEMDMLTKDKLSFN